MERSLRDFDFLYRQKQIPYIIRRESNLDSHCQLEYMHIYHTETRITAAFFRLQTSSMDDWFVLKTESLDETLSNSDAGV